MADRTVGGGVRLVVVDPDENTTVVMLLSGGRPYDMVVIRALSRQHVDVRCASVSGVPTCLVDGVPGAHTAFGAVVQVDGGRIRPLATDLAAEGGFEVANRTADTLLLAGPVSSFSYGLSYAAAPQAWRTYLVSGRALHATGCGAPSFTLSAAPRDPQTGPCSGTPEIAGFGTESARKLADLGQGAVSVSGNIACVVQGYGTAQLDCSIGTTDFSVAKNCAGQPGTIVRWLSGGRPTLSGCAGDTMVTAGRTVLPYDTLAVAGGFGCVIRQIGGVRCQDITGHGFMLGRAAYRTF